ncbi:Hypothetical protein BFG00_1533 [Corynebacterium pseudotuberculosis]|nr:Hypothetical protein CpE19_1467 [Corynebacterium pseudotuberculosis]ATB62423.1 Hypothetical protein BFF96_1548 [Corynebacterium pseudotuberculosis]AUY60919.1 Hypothetical protein BFG00_1533 [Corynebacterium pseudotuberculosis]
MCLFTSVNFIIHHDQDNRSAWDPAPLRKEAHASNGPQPMQHKV